MANQGTKTTTFGKADRAHRGEYAQWPRPRPWSKLLDGGLTGKLVFFDRQGGMECVEARVCTG